MTSNEVIAALQAGPFPKNGYAWLFEVRNSTGYGKRDRYADALVVSCWPSRGIWVAGLEVKVDRQDWKRELEDPAKSAEVQKFCDYWWVAAPEGVVEEGEVPETWGLLVVSEKKGGRRVRREREAPRLSREEWDLGFVASLLRNQAQRLEGERKAGYSEGYHEAAEEYDEEKIVEMGAELLEATRESQRLKRQARYAKEAEQSLLRHVASVEREMGLPCGAIATRGPHAARNVGALYRAAVALSETRPADIAERFEGAARALRRLP